MKFDTESLRTLKAVADTGSINAAAELVCLSPSAVSWKLKRLQERTGCTLLQRDGRGVRLTDDGIELLAYAEQILTAHDAAVRRFMPMRRSGRIRIGSTEAASTPLLETVAPWIRRNGPDIDLHVAVEQPLTLDDWLREGRIDLAVNIVLESDLRPTDVVVRHDELVWAHSATGAFTTESPLPLITYGPRCFFGSLAAQLLTSAGIDFDITYELSTTTAVRTALASGAGVALINRGMLTDDHATWAGPEPLPEPPGVRYVIRSAPTERTDPLHALVIEQIRLAFTTSELTVAV